MTTIPSTIFRAYDIRGIYEETLTLEGAYAIGRAFATYVQEHTQGNRICVGFDGRLSSPALEESLVKGMLASGADVIRVGLGPTPLLYFAVKYLHADAGIMVTGSHNPPTHNGFKMLLASQPLFGEHIQSLKQMIDTNALVDGSGAVTFESVTQAYLDHLCAALTVDCSNMHIAWDPGNGAAGEITTLLTQRLPGKHTVINETIDGLFPAHHPDPTVPENMAQLIDLVKSKQCDMGIAFDGDGDRIGVVANDGQLIWGDQLLTIYAKDVLNKQPGATIIADVKASQTLFEEVKRLGGNPLMWRTGHSFIKVKMREVGAPLAGEMSGHIFFADNYGFDDGVFAGVKLIESIGHAGRKLSEIVADIPTMVSTPEIRIDVDDTEKFLVMERIAQQLESMDLVVNTIDGVRVSHSYGWWLLRASNTQAALVARCEASTEKDLERLTSELYAVLKAENIAPSM